MRIGYDTLSENPFRPSSAINYIQSLLSAVARLSPADEFFVFVSPHNKRYFPCDRKNLTPTQFRFSNENIPARIAVQQLAFPITSRRLKLDVLYGLNQAPLISHCPTVIKLCTVHHHVTPQEYQSNVGSMLRLYYRRIMFDASARRARIVIANSEYTRDVIVRSMKIPKSKVRIVYEAVDDSFGTFEAGASREFVRNKLGIERPFILYVSNLWYYKNPDGALRSFIRLRQSYKDDVDFVVAGRDEFDRIPSLRELAHQNGLGMNTHFLGHVSFETLLNLYSAARVIYYPSLAETFGKPVVEGMRSGVPLVTSNRTSIPELAGNAALLVDPEDTEANADALHRAVTDETLRQNLITRGLARAKDFSWDRVAKGTLDAWRDALN